MNNTTSKKIKAPAFIALLLGTAILAFAPILVRLSENAPSSIAFWRVTLSTPILALAWMLLPAPKSVSHKVKSFWDYMVLVLAGVFFALDLVVWNIALGYTSVANATLFVNFASLFLALISWLILKKPLGSGLVTGMFIAIAGSILLVWPHLEGTDNSLMGDGLSLLAACFYGMYLLFVQIARKHFGTLSIMTLTGVVTASAALLLALSMGENIQVNEWAAWYPLIGLAVVQILGQGFIAYALAELSATLSSIVLLLQPAIAAVIAWKLFDEDLLMIQLIGMSIVIVGIAFAKMGSGSKSAVSAAIPIPPKLSS